MFNSKLIFWPKFHENDSGIQYCSKKKFSLRIHTQYPPNQQHKTIICESDFQTKFRCTVSQYKSIMEDKITQKDLSSLSAPNTDNQKPPTAQEDPAISQQNTSITSPPSLEIENSPPIPEEQPIKTETIPSVPQGKPLQIYDSIYLTGFNKFGTYSFNPTEMAVDIIQQKNLPGVTCQVLDCSIGGVDRYIQRMKERLLQQKKEERILHLHFGVGGHLYELEKQAFNYKDFGDLEDNQGNRPQGEVIIKDGPSPIKTVVDTVQLKNYSDAEFDMRTSNDPGMFICNYIYYLSMHQLQGNFPGNDSLFVHIPYRKDPNKYLERDVRCIEDLIGNLQRKRRNLTQQGEEIVDKWSALNQPLIKYDHIFLTGFNRFNEAEFNPSEDAVKKIQERKLPGVTCEVVGCSMRQATNYITTKEQLQGYEGKNVLHLHMGVGGDHYEIERYCINKTDFGNFLDNDGESRHGGFILEGNPNRLQTRVGICELKQRLKDKMKGDLPSEVEVWINEVQYYFICNYIYYKSCLLLQRELHHSLFLHVPYRDTQDDKLADTDLKCIEALIDILLKKKNLTTE